MVEAGGGLAFLVRNQPKYDQLNNLKDQMLIDIRIVKATYHLFNITFVRGRAAYDSRRINEQRQLSRLYLDFGLASLHEPPRELWTGDITKRCLQCSPMRSGAAIP